MSTDHENWQDNSDENQISGHEENRSINRESKFNRNSNYNGGERPSYNRSEGSDERAFRPASFNRGNRPQRPRFSRPSNGGERVNYNRDDRERPSYNRDNGDRRPAYRPSYNNNREEGERRPYRPSYNNNRDGGEQRYNSYNRGERSERPQRSYNNPYNNSYNNNSYNNNSYNSEERPRFRRNNGNVGNSYNRNGGEGGGYRPRYNNSYGNRRPQQQSNGFRPRRTEGYDPNAKYSKKKQMEYRDILADPNEPIRLNKYLANAGVCSRREADEYITAGVVSVNGVVVTELGTKVKRSDAVTFHNEPVSLERKVYVLLNKPKDCVTTSEDPQERKTVMDFVKGACKERIYPVGRLDRNTTGVLLLTNDGDLASKLTHPKYLKKKIYQVRCDKEIAQEDMDKIASGITLDDGEIHADEISYISEDKADVGIEIHSGKNRIVRRIFEALGYRVVKLDRVFFAGLTKKNLRRGQWRYLTEKEVNMLRMGAFE